MPILSAAGIGGGGESWNCWLAAWACAEARGGDGIDGPGAAGAGGGVGCGGAGTTWLGGADAEDAAAEPLVGFAAAAVFAASAPAGSGGEAEEAGEMESVH